MKPWDDRGQSIQIGAVLVFAAVVVLLAIYQASVVPQQNERVEFDHSQQVRGDLLDLRNAVVSTIGDSSQRSVAVTLGTTYPSRVLAVNPPPVSGQLRTVGTADSDVSFELDNAVALDPETADFWDGAVDPGDRYSTGSVVYRPSYNEYGQPPRTVYDSAVLYDNFSFEGTTIARSGQTLVDGSTISLVALNGSLQRSSSAATAVDVRPISASTTTVAVTNRNAGPIEIRTATRLPNSTWSELLADEPNVTHWETSSLAVDGFRTLKVDLRPGTYELRMAKAGVGTRVSGTEPAYLTGVRGNGSTVPEGGSQQFVVELRDRYNNPVAGEPVTADASWTADAVATERTGNDGRASFVYQAPANGGGQTERVNVSIGANAPPAAFRGGTPENVSLNVTVVDTDVTGAGGGDGRGPDVTGQTASPDPVDQGSQVTLSGRVSDIERGGIDVIAAEWFRVAPGGTLDGQDPGNGSANPLSPTDGSWDQAIEAVTDTSTASWQNGTHTIAFRGKDANGNWGAVRTTAVRVVETTNDPSAFQFSNFQGFAADPSTDEFTLDRIRVQDADSDDDLDRIEYVVTDSNGDTVAAETVNGIGPGQYQPEGSPAVTITGSQIRFGETYTLAATVYDADGNFDSRTRQYTVAGDDTSPTFGYTQAGAQANNGGKNVEYVVFRASASDNVEVDRIEVSVFDKGGTEIGSDTFGPSFNNQRVTVAPTNMQGSGNSITVELTAYDTSGNSRTCRGRIDELYQYIDNSGSSGLSCETTSP